MYDIGLQLLGVRDDTHVQCSITESDATSHNRACKYYNYFGSF